MTDRQKTIQESVSVSGVGLHTGETATVRLRPAEADSGIRFVRTDLPGRPEIPAVAENVHLSVQVARCTSVGQGEAVIHTVEHLMSVLSGLGIDNLVIEVEGRELPGLDGSARDYLRLLQRAGVREQDAPRRWCEIREPIGVNSNGASILIVPDKEFRVSYTLAYDHPFLRAQFFSGVVNEALFAEQIAPARTFCLQEEAEELRRMGLGLGASYDNTLVVGEAGVIQNTPRFPDEFARHKVLDFIGDFYLTGCPVRGHVFAVRSGHQLNLALIRKVRERYLRETRREPSSPRSSIEDGGRMDIREVMNHLPHRYPFLLVDRVVSLEKGKRIVALKNVTMNEPHFTGHFPSRPVMPGVLMVEALAQAGGILLLSQEAHRGQAALFMAVDQVKFRKVVEPGDRLILEVAVERDRRRTAVLQGCARVGDEVVVEAQMMFAYTTASFLDVGAAG